MVTTLPLPRTPAWRLIGVALLALSMLYVLAVDQGLLLSLVQGQMAFDQNLIHETVHDARHIAAIPCH